MVLTCGVLPWLDGFPQLLIYYYRPLGYTQKIYKVHCIVHSGVIVCQSQGNRHNGHNDHGDLLYNTKFRWPMSWQFHEACFRLCRGIVSSVSEWRLKGIEKYSDKVWVCRLGFFTHAISQLNKFRIKLQGRDVPIMTMEADAAQEKLHPFPSPSPVMKPSFNSEECVSVLSTRRSGFPSHLADVRYNPQDRKLQALLFTLRTTTSPLMCNWNRSSAYACEQLFSRMSFSESKLSSPARTISFIAPVSKKIQHTISQAIVNLLADQLTD